MEHIKNFIAGLVVTGLVWLLCFILEAYTLTVIGVLVSTFTIYMVGKAIRNPSSME